MSYTTWINYGIGLKTDLVKTENSKIRNLLERAPKFKARFEKYIEESELSNEAEISLLDVYSEGYEDFGGYELAGLLFEVISEAEGIRLCPCDDYNGYNFLLFAESLPWEFNEKERNLTAASVKEIFEKYISIITNQSLNELEYGDWKVENGG